MADNGGPPPQQTESPAGTGTDTRTAQTAGTAGRDGADTGAGGEAATIAELRAEVARLTDQWRRALADLDNYQKRVTRTTGQQRAEERARVSAEWLPVLDNLDLALEHGASDPASIVQGVQAVRDQALSILSRLGYPRRTDLGEVFDPARHEAVAASPDPRAVPGTVVQVVRPGYGDDEHQLRPASVVVATGPG